MRQKLGQHFLTSRGVVKKIATAIVAKPKDIIIEIGPGHGELTFALLEEHPKNTILSIERDAELLDDLRKRFAENKKWKLVHADALVALPELVAGLPAKTAFHVVGNLPYYISGHLFRILTELPRLPASTVVMVQEEVAERIVATPPHMNRLAASIQIWAHASITSRVDKRQFNPAPNVDSAVIRLETKKGGLKAANERYYDMLHTLFQQPRKTILNNLQAGAKKNNAVLGKEKIMRMLTEIGIDPTARPAMLSIASIAKLAQQFA